MRVGFVGRPEPNDAPHKDQRRTVIGFLEFSESCVDRRHIVGVINPERRSIPILEIVAPRFR